MTYQIHTKQHHLGNFTAPTRSDAIRAMCKQHGCETLGDMNLTETDLEVYEISEPQTEIKE